MCRITENMTDRFAVICVKIVQNNGGFLDQEWKSGIFRHVENYIMYGFCTVNEGCFLWGIAVLFLCAEKETPEWK